MAVAVNFNRSSAFFLLVGGGGGGQIYKRRGISNYVISTMGELALKTFIVLWSL